MGTFAKANVLTLWIYSENDVFFRPELAQAMLEDFLRSRGTSNLVIAPPFGHALLSRVEGRNIWASYGDEFLLWAETGKWCQNGFGRNWSQYPVKSGFLLVIDKSRLRTSWVVGQKNTRHLYTVRSICDNFSSASPDADLRSKRSPRPCNPKNQRGNRISWKSLYPFCYVVPQICRNSNYKQIAFNFVNP